MSKINSYTAVEQCTWGGPLEQLLENAWGNLNAVQDQVIACKDSQEEKKLLEKEQHYRRLLHRILNEYPQLKVWLSVSGISANH